MIHAAALSIVLFPHTPPFLCGDSGERDNMSRVKRPKLEFSRPVKNANLAANKPIETVEYVVKKDVIIAEILSTGQHNSDYVVFRSARGECFKGKLPAYIGKHCDAFTYEITCVKPPTGQSGTTSFVIADGQPCYARPRPLTVSLLAMMIRDVAPMHQATHVPEDEEDAALRIHNELFDAKGVSLYTTGSDAVHQGVKTRPMNPDIVRLHRDMTLLVMSSSYFRGVDRTYQVMMKWLGIKMHVLYTMVELNSMNTALSMRPLFPVFRCTERRSRSSLSGYVAAIDANYFIRSAVIATD